MDLDRCSGRESYHRDGSPERPPPPPFPSTPPRRLYPGSCCWALESERLIAEIWSGRACGAVTMPVSFRLWVRACFPLRALLVWRLGRRLSPRRLSPLTADRRGSGRGVAGLLGLARVARRCVAGPAWARVSGQPVAWRAAPSPLRGFRFLLANGPRSC